MDLKKNFWEDIYNRNIKKMIGICFRYVPDRQIAEDLAHDAFLKAMHKSDTFKGKGYFEAWLRKITINTALQHIRDEKVKNENQREFSFQDLINNDKEMDRWQDFKTQELLETINKLPEHHRLVFNLYVIDKYSHKQIAYKLNISEGTSKSHLARARKKLQHILNEKLREKEKKNKRSLMFIIFPFGFGRINRLYKNRFTNFEIKPQNTSFIDNYEWLNVNQPKFKIFYNISNFIILAVVGLAVIFTVIVVFNKKSKINIQEKNTVFTIDTLLPTENIDTVLKSTDTILETKISQKQPPVIVKKQRIIKKMVIVRDTVIVIDTINAK